MQREPNAPARRSGHWLAIAIAVTGGLLPLLLYAATLGRAPTALAPDAMKALREGPDHAALVDVRSPARFAAGHIAGAINWPYAEIVKATSSASLPTALQGKTIYTICDVGWQSARAAEHLAGISDVIAQSVRGGIQEWTRWTAIPPRDDFDRWQTPEGVEPFAYRDSPPYEQAAAVLSFFGFKALYTLLSLGAIIALWRAKSPDLVALRWAMICFFVGENICELNWQAFEENSYLSEYLHSYGMLLAFGFAVYAVIEAIDLRILMLSDPTKRCAALPLCRQCIKHAEVPCGLRRVFLVLLPGLMAFALMLPLAEWHTTAYNTRIFDKWYNYTHFFVYQIFETWYCGLAAFAMFALSLGFLYFEGNRTLARAKVAFAAGMGPLCFGMLRTFMSSAYDQNRVWYLFWEETTELLFLTAVVAILWIFRHSLFRPAAAKPAEPVAPGV